MHFQLLKPKLESQTQPVHFRVAMAKQYGCYDSIKCDGYTKIVRLLSVDVKFIWK